MPQPQIAVDADLLLDLQHLLYTAAGINRDYLSLLPEERRSNPTENYVDRFRTAAHAVMKARTLAGA